MCTHFQEGGANRAPSLRITPFWLVVWACALALAWVLPNHYYPWPGFHMDAWMACILLSVSLWLLWANKAQTPGFALLLIPCLSLLVIAVQYASGLLVQAGNAWVSGLYVLGFLLAALSGARWASVSKWQLLDGLFLAIGIASFTSVGLQLHQWLQLDYLGIWSMGGGETRPFGNMGQPNQLATLLIWGVLALLWGVERHRIKAKYAGIGAAFLLFGVALTLSRTAWLGGALLLVMICLWRHRWTYKNTHWVASALAIYFIGCIYFVQWVPHAWWGDAWQEWTDIASRGGSTRLTLWSLCIDAALHQPWWGYGWNQTGLAQMAVALNHAPVHEYFSSAHNLFLDLILWCGIPIGATVSVYLLWWMVSRALRIKTSQDAVMWLLLLVVANHALLELPLYYAYFLLPVGLVMGALDARLGREQIFTVGRGVSLAMLMVATLILALVIRDYVLVEQTHLRLRYQWVGIKGVQVVPPDVMLLTQWKDFVQIALQDPNKVMTDAEILWLQNSVGLMPNAGFFQLLALGRVQRREYEKAAQTLDTMCSVMTPAICESVTAFWTARAKQDPDLAAVPWPRKS